MLQSADGEAAPDSDNQGVVIRVAAPAAAAEGGVSSESAETSTSSAEEGGQISPKPAKPPRAGSG